MTSFTVATPDLRAALQSVAPHAEQDPDDPLHRIRVDVGQVNVTVSATQRFTAALAIVSVEDNHDGQLEAFDLMPQDVKEILALFKGKAGSDGSMGETVRLDVTDQHVRVTDTAGLFEGKSLQLLRAPTHDRFPDLQNLLSHTIRKAGAWSDRLVTRGQLTQLFTAAAKAYDAPLVIEPTGLNSSLIISCGESFLGLLMPMRRDEEFDDVHNGYRAAWLRRLPHPKPLTRVAVDVPNLDEYDKPAGDDGSDDEDAES